jgi:hypothetical protein
MSKTAPSQGRTDSGRRVWKECDTNLTNLSIDGISSVCPVHWPSVAPSRGRVKPALETRLRQKYQSSQFSTIIDNIAPIRSCMKQVETLSALLLVFTLEYIMRSKKLKRQWK